MHHPHLALPPTGEALLGLPAGRDAAVHLAGRDLGRDQSRPVEDAARAAAEAYEQDPDPTLDQHVLDQPDVGRQRPEGHLHLGHHPVLRDQPDLLRGRCAQHRSVPGGEAVEPALQPLR